MNWCNPHWQQLRAAVAAKGLDKLGAQTGEQAAADIQSQLQGTEEKFDPLLGSWARLNAKMGESLHRLGRGHEVLQLKCPMCTLVADGQPELVADWIEGVTESARRYAVEQGFIQVN